MREDFEKRAAIRILLLAPSVLILFFLVSLLVISYFHYVHDLTILLISAILLMAASIVLVRYKKIDLAKYILILTPSYTLLMVSILAEQNGILPNVYTYLAPKFFGIIYLISPIVFFGISFVRKMVISYVLLLPSVLLFDFFHKINGIYVADLTYDYQYYNLFFGIISFVFLMALITLILYQKSNLLFKNKVALQKEQIIEERKEIEVLNEYLKFQANLYLILNVLTENKSLKETFDRILNEILKIKNDNNQTRGLIVLAEEDDTYRLVSQKGFDYIKVFDSKEIERLFNLDDAYFTPIVEDGVTLGYIVVFIENQTVLNIDFHNYLNAISSILARSVILEKKNSNIKRNAERIIEQQKILTSTLDELQESIDYAKSIQESRLPDKSHINNLLKDSDVLFLPRDTVSGDFYFAYGNKDVNYFGIGDCTGHGIPGAFLASMSIEAVWSVIKENEGKLPNKILNELRSLAADRFEIAADGLTDSMDAALCMYDNVNRKLYFSGGFMNLLLVRNNTELLEFPGTKCPIGMYPTQEDFCLHEISIEKNDTIILTSDGYYDQFGKAPDRTKPSKFMKKRFKELLLKISHFPSRKQVEILKETFVTWKGSLNQTDDVSVFVVKF